jgi:Ca2+-binding EF-hand superfamily protein
MMAYERCVNKKLRSLFEFLDADRDGRITSECLLSGINRLLTDMNMYSDSPSNNNNTGSTSTGDEVPSTICEYEVEELLRCIPS